MRKKDDLINRLLTAKESRKIRSLSHHALLAGIRVEKMDDELEALGTRLGDIVVFEFRKTAKAGEVAVIDDGGAELRVKKLTKGCKKNIIGVVRRIERDISK